MAARRVPRLAAPAAGGGSSSVDGVSLVLDDDVTRLELATTRQVRYATIHPRGHALDPGDDALAGAVELRPALLVLDRHVERLYGEQIRAYGDARLQVAGVVIVEGSEKAKGWDQLRRLCDEAIAASLPRNGVIVAFGGGVTLDLAGLAASIYRRGVRFVRVPTSLIGQVDVGVGIKHGINVGDHKNVVGSFHVATNVNEPAFLASLPRRHIACGLAEIVKMAMVCDEELFSMVERHCDELLERRFQAPAAARSILLRSEHVMMRELQKNLFEEESEPRLPDFGHTFGPAIEAGSSYAVAHGEAVAMDMAISASIAAARGICRRDDRDRLLELLGRIGLPLADPRVERRLLVDAVAQARAHRGGRLNLVVPRSVGRGCFLQEVGQDEIARALDETLALPRAPELAGCEAP